MADSAFSSFFAYFGWTFIPGYATSILQTLYYKITIPVGRQAPQPGQPLYALHHRRIRIFVLCLYLVYTLAQALYDVKLAGDFYTILGVTPSSTEREVKARFRRLAARFHPDKVRETNSDATDTEQIFLALKLAQDTILDPSKRFAYDRFGPSVVQLQHPGLKTIRDYVYAGLRSKVPEYAVSATSLAVLNYVWLPAWGQYWRYFAVCCLAFLELYFLTHEWNPSRVLLHAGSTFQNVLPDLIPEHLLPYQLLTVARRLSLSLNIFISQLAPPSIRNKADQDRQVQQQIAHLANATSRSDTEAEGLLKLGVAPFKDDLERKTVLKAGMKESMVLGAIRNTPEVREAVRRALDARGLTPAQP